MAEKALVDGQQLDSIELIKKLDATGNPPSKAIWYFYEDVSDWKLILAGPTLDALFPKQEEVAYSLVVDAIKASNLTSLTIANIKIMPTHAPLIKALGFLMRTDPKSLGRAHFVNTTLNGIFMKEMIIIRSA